MKTILIVTHRRGFEADPVIDLLRERGINIFRFNCDSGSEVSSISFRPDRNEIEFMCDNRRVSARGISVGWCQQLPPYLDEPTNTRQQLQNQNLWAMHAVIFDTLPFPWFNKPSNVLRASNKILQLKVARKLKLAVPDTLFSNDPAVIRKFAQGRIIVAKNLATPWVVSNNKTRAAYTRIVRKGWLTSDKSLSFCPIIYQEYHQRRRDWRVVVVGSRSFAAYCKPGKNQREDIRKGQSTGKSFRADTFDKGTLKKLCSLMEEFSLNYCAADFMEDTSGNLYFLEINTCGAWWWLDKLYNREICCSLTDALVSQAV